MTRGSVKPPDAAYVRARWIKRDVVNFVYECDEILREHGAVQGTKVYETRHQARYRAQKLIREMVELRVRNRWELKEHTEPRGEGWTWTVELIGGPNGS